MMWLWIYLGGMAVWIVGGIAVGIAVEPDPKEHGPNARVILTFALVWPLGLLLFAGALLGHAAKAKYTTKT